MVRCSLFVERYRETLIVVRGSLIVARGSLIVVRGSLVVLTGASLFDASEGSESGVDSLVMPQEEARRPRVFSFQVR